VGSHRNYNDILPQISGLYIYLYIGDINTLRNPQNIGGTIAPNIGGTIGGSISAFIGRFIGTFIAGPIYQGIGYR
jgi:hypothetical protein